MVPFICFAGLVAIFVVGLTAVQKQTRKRISIKRRFKSYNPHNGKVGLTGRKRKVSIKSPKSSKVDLTVKKKKKVKYKRPDPYD